MILKGLLEASGRQAFSSKIQDNILCIDIGTSTGFSVVNNCSVVSSGCVVFKSGTIYKESVKYALFRQWFKETIEQYGINTVFFEIVHRHSGTIAAHIYGGFVGHLSEMCYSNNIRLHTAEVSHIKIAACGNGRAKKEQVIAGVKKKGFNPYNDDEADAIALGIYVSNGIHENLFSKT